MTSATTHRSRLGRTVCSSPESAPMANSDPMQEMTDDELVAAAKGGTKTAFAELHRRYIEYLRSLAREKVEAADLDDVCQDIFSLAFTRLDTFKGDSEFKTWLTAIANRECFRIIQNRTRVTKGSAYLDRSVDVDKLGDELELRRTPEWEQQFIDVEKRLDLPKMISTVDPILPPKSRRLVKAVTAQGAELNDVAKLEGEPLKTVESRLSRILQKLEKQISPK
jgi:RNA polymerase sigma-70 factor, ECF subfamily